MDYIFDKEKIFSIHKKISENKKLELVEKRFKSIPLIDVDEFTGTKEIKWKSIAGKYEDKLNDCFKLQSNDTNKYLLLFTFNNIESKDYIIFRYFPKEYNLSVGTKVSFLFECGEIIDFEIISKPYKYSHLDGIGNVFESKVQIIEAELNMFKDKKLVKWQIYFFKTQKKINGTIDSDAIQIGVNILIKDYFEIVKKEIKEYQPLLERKEIISPTTLINDERCYVYLMMDLNNNYHKIGISNKPEYREKTLQSEKPTIEMVCNKSFPNRKIASSFEQALHQAYAYKRIRGEWFKLSEKEVQDIKETLIS